MNIDINSLILLGIAVMNAATAFIAWRTHQSAMATQVNIQKVETATNSMKDALVAATEKSAHAAGRAEVQAEIASTAGAVEQAFRDAGAASPPIAPKV